MFAEALAALLSEQPGIEVMGSASTVAAAVAAARRLSPDVVVMDYRLPDGEGTAAARSIRDHDPQTRVLILTASAEESVLREAMRAGCSGIVTKGRGIADLVRAVRAAAAGETVLAPSLVDRLASPPSSAPGSAVLTERELEVLRLVAEGLDTPDIAARLGISVVTVRNHVGSCIRKLGVHTRTQAVSAAIRRGIIPAPG